MPTIYYLTWQDDSMDAGNMVHTSTTALRMVKKDGTTHIDYCNPHVYTRSSNTNAGIDFQNSLKHPKFFCAMTQYLLQHQFTICKSVTQCYTVLHCDWLEVNTACVTKTHTVFCNLRFLFDQ